MTTMAIPSTPPNELALPSKELPEVHSYELPSPPGSAPMSRTTSNLTQVSSASSTDTSSTSLSRSTSATSSRTDSISSPSTSAPKSLTRTITINPTDSISTASTATSTVVRHIVDVTKPVEPPVTYLEILRFVVWSIAVIVTQLLRDLSVFKFYKPLLATDFMTHYFYIPVGRRDPRVVTSGPHNRMTIRTIPAKTTRQYERLEDLTVFPESEVINCASSNYGGFTDLEFDSVKVIESGLRSLPFCPPPKLLEDTVKVECARFMGFKEAFTVPSGFGTNLLAFGTVARVAASQGRQLVFLLDRDSHNSMFTGAFYHKNAQIHKFNHNDIGDLEFKLRMYREQAPAAFICVAIEGTYSMQGSISPGPAILALKRIYNFSLLIDEAHSFMALGSSGKGSFNHWQDLGYECPLSQVDVMVCTFSKSFGCLGGLVLANGSFANALHKQGEEITRQGGEKLSTTVSLRILSLLRKPLLIQDRMRLIQEKAGYVAKALSSAGCKILSSPGSAIVCFPVGTVRQVAVFHGEAMKRGMAIVGGVPPATPMWGCRVRICIFATTTWPDIYQLLTTTISISQQIKVRGIRPKTFDEGLLNKKDYCHPLIKQQSKAADQHVLEFVELLKTKAPIKEEHIGNSKEIVEAGVQGLKKYGIGSCSARWFYGSFDIFVQLEKRLANLYPSLVQQSGGCRAMVSADAEVLIGCTITAVVVPTTSKKTVNAIFVYSAAPKRVLNGAAMHKECKGVMRKYYDNTDDIPSMMDFEKPTHLTLYLLTSDPEGHQILDLGHLLARSFKDDRVSQKVTGITLILDDRHGLGRLGPNKLGWLDLMESLHGHSFLSEICGTIKPRVRIMVAGSWFDAFGHPGGYVTGQADMVEVLTWNTKGYFFATPPMPLQTCMTDKVLETLQQRRDEKPLEQLAAPAA